MASRGTAGSAGYLGAPTPPASGAEVMNASS
jgi:hypothetical protein